MNDPRHGHSACAVGNKYIVVTGGRIGTGTSSEIFDVNQNKWSRLPEMTVKRHYHSSCAFEGKSVFVFCGIHNDTRSYINSIERLDVSLFSNNIVSAWQPYQLNHSPTFTQFSARQGLGSCQIDQKGILIVGGYSGKHTSDSFYIDVNTKEISKTQGQLPLPTFPFAVPTLSDVKRQLGFSVDWCSYKLLKFED